MELHNFDRTAFLRDTWQRKPLLMRQALAGWANPLDPDELAGLLGVSPATVANVLKLRDTLSTRL